MARVPNEQVSEALKLYKQGMKLVEIASQLNLPAGTVRRWKSTYKWDNERSGKKSERSQRKKGGQPGNHNATGPPGNKNALKHGLFAKYLPEETLDIIQATEQANPLDLLWDNIQIQYVAIIRAQQIMYVKNKDDITKEVKSGSCGENSENVSFDIQFAWDKQANFLSAQSRAMTTLHNMIKNYDELIHKNWDMVTEEQKARIETLRSKINNENSEDDSTISEMLEGLK